MARHSTKDRDKLMIPLARPHLGENEIREVEKVLHSGWVTQGPKVKEFEDAFASYVGSVHACAVSNCTSALHLALLTVGVKPGDIVITVSYSFIGTANSVRLCNAEPVFVDIDPRTYNISPAALEKFLKAECVSRDGGLYHKNVEKLIVEESPLAYIDRSRIGRVAAVMPVHQLGMPCDIDAIINIAGKYNLPVVEDAACALGSEVKKGQAWEKIGKPHGDIACFSFHPRKIITTGDGGMLTTNRSEYDRHFRLLRNHGMDVSGSDRKESKKVVVEKYLLSGFNYRMTDIQAAVGLTQLRQLPEFVGLRRKINKYYRTHLENISWLELPFEPEDVQSNWQSYSIKVLKGAPRSRDEIIQYLFDAGVCCIPGIRNSYWEIPYSHVSYDLTESQKAQDSVIIFPLHINLSEVDIKHIGDLLRQLESK